MQTFVRGTDVRFLLDIEHMFVKRSRQTRCIDPLDGGEVATMGVPVLPASRGRLQSRPARRGSSIRTGHTRGAVVLPRQHLRPVGLAPEPIRPVALGEWRGSAPSVCRSGSRADRQARRRARAVRRLLPTVAMVAVLLLTWFVAGSLTGARTGGYTALPGAKPVQGGYLYTVRNGDSLWSIASAMSPNGDPRPLVDELASELAGSPLQAGEKLRLP